MKYRTTAWLVLGLLLAMSVSACSGFAAAPEPEETPTDEPTTEPTAEPGENDLAGTAWVLTQINGGAPVAGTQFTLSFDESELGGQACNQYSGPYTASGGTLEVGPLIRTDMFCTEPAGAMDQETAYFGLLEQAATYRLSEGQLTIGTANNPSALVLAASTGEPTAEPTGEAGANDLVGTAWVLTQINGGAPVAGTQFTLSFDESELGGQACNHYGGPYTASAGVLEVGDIVSTMMACVEPAGAMDQEAAYFDLLGNATRYEISAGQLTLGAADNPSALVFVEGAVQAPPQGWLTYQDAELGFEVSYPVAVTDPDAPVSSPPMGEDEVSVRFDLPFAPGANLQEKYLQIDARANAEQCASPLAEGYAPGTLQPETVTFGDVTWEKVSGSDAGAGNFYEFTAYSTLRDGVCVSLTFVLHSTNAMNYPTPPPEFDRAAESAIFDQIVQTFRWLP